MVAVEKVFDYKVGLLLCSRFLVWGQLIFNLVVQFCVRYKCKIAKITCYVGQFTEVLNITNTAGLGQHFYPQIMM